VIDILESEDQSLPALRRLDAPQEQLPFDRASVSLRREGFDYRNAYAPAERPLSRIIDKCFYRPGNREIDRYRSARSPVTPRRQTLFPLSGRGKRIVLEDYDGGRRVRWGNTRFDLPEDLIADILDNYFRQCRSWYPLGASMDDPTSGGLGQYVQNNFRGLTPRHASAIAAIMVQDGLVEFRGRRPIELRKLDIE